MSGRHFASCVQDSAQLGGDVGTGHNASVEHGGADGESPGSGVAHEPDPVHARDGSRDQDRDRRRGADLSDEAVAVRR